ncbi:MAG: hypothetical protein LBB73_05370 [Dysgonamonadaceae bacterium]|jgi:hypothetical protein|nr:hypothetical protein [Dysgonamonadaceae bacterium]
MKQSFRLLSFVLATVYSCSQNKGQTARVVADVALEKSVNTDNTENTQDNQI